MSSISAFHSTALLNIARGGAEHLARGGALPFKNAPTRVIRPQPPLPPSKNVLIQIYRSWFKISELGRFFVSGNLGNMCFFFLERAVSRQLSQMSELPEFVEDYKDSVSFFIAYILQIVTQHLFNAVLVYGIDTINTWEKYFKTLLGQYSAYGFALVGSTCLNMLLLRIGMDKTIAFFTTLTLFACINYFLIGWMVRRTTATAVEPSAKDIAVKKVRRGGCFQSIPLLWYTSQNLLHHLVLNTGNPINVVDVNNHSYAECRNSKSIRIIVDSMSYV